MTTTERDQIAAELFADEETGMTWHPVESSQISEVGYDASTATLGIRFKPGKRSPASEYHYANVPVGTHHALVTAESVGTYFGQNIKSRPDLFPYTKVEMEIPVRKSTFIPKEQVAAFAADKPDVSVEVGEALPPGTALAVIDSMADDLLFTPGAVTDAQLAAGRDWYLTEAKKYDISTEKSRAEFKRFARPLQKLRTGIEARAKELTGATKRKIAAIDAEKRRLVQIVGGIENEVLAPLTSWEAEEAARKIRLAGICTQLAQYGQSIYPDIRSIEITINILEGFDLSTMQEYKIGAESAIIASLKVLKPELARRKESEAQAAELAKLRAEAAERAEQDRMAAAAKAAREQAERDAALELQYAESKRLAAEQAVKDAETRRILAEEKAARDAEIAAAQAERDREAAVEAERKRAADAAKREQEAAEARAADEKQRNKVNYEAAYALASECLIDEPEAHCVIDAIAKGLIPHLRIEY